MTDNSRIGRLTIVLLYQWRSVVFRGPGGGLPVLAPKLAGDFFLHFDNLVAVYPGAPTTMTILLLCLQCWYIVDLSYIDVPRSCIQLI